MLGAARYHDISAEDLEKRIKGLGGINECMKYAPRKKPKKKK
jgi:hypothetical protein